MGTDMLRPPISCFLFFGFLLLIICLFICCDTIFIENIFYTINFFCCIF